VVSTTGQIALKAILRRAPEFIPWPTAIQRSVIREQFERNYGIPDCIGLMDGCQVNLKAQSAREDAGAFHSWKNESGLLFVAIVDYDDLRIRYIQYGYPALSSDHRIQRSMNVFTEHPQYFSPSQYVLADSHRYQPLHPHVHQTKPDRASFTSSRLLNMKAGPMRVKVEQTFGILNSRFPALRSLGQRLCSRRDQARAHGFISALFNLWPSVVTIERMTAEHQHGFKRCRVDIRVFVGGRLEVLTLPLVDKGD